MLTLAFFAFLLFYFSGLRRLRKQSSNSSQQQTAKLNRLATVVAGYLIFRGIFKR